MTMLEVPSSIDRAQGDIHPGGNPHIHLDPRNIRKIAVAFTERMAQLDSAEANNYRGRAKKFLERWQQAIARWEKQAAPLKGMKVIVYHKNMTYLDAWLGMREFGEIEPKPGLPPTTAHLSGCWAAWKRSPLKRWCGRLITSRARWSGCRNKRGFRGDAAIYGGRHG